MDNKWIPTSERLPEVDKYGEAYVLVCMDDEFIATTTDEALKQDKAG